MKQLLDAVPAAFSNGEDNDTDKKERCRRMMTAYLNRKGIPLNGKRIERLMSLMCLESVFQAEYQYTM